jgi:Chaperone of endosialidase
MDKASEVLFALQPVSFHYKKEIDPMGLSQFGFVAEDVEKVSPDLVARDKDGKAYTVRYDQMNAMLLNEFLKEHKAFLELKKEIAALRAAVEQQAGEIEKVSAQRQITESVSEVADRGR